MKIRSFINLTWGHLRYHTKFESDRFSHFDVYWKQTNRQTDKLNLYILYIQSYNQNEHIDLLQTQKFGLIYFPFNIQVISFLQGYIHFRDQACILKLKVLTLDNRDQTFKNNCISSQKFRPMVVLKMACFSDSIFLFSCEKMYDP